MSFRSLSEFLGELERRGDLRRVTREVDWACEVTEIACREAKAEGPALLFENVRGAKFPLAVNVLAATRRIEWALGRTARSVGAEIEEIFHALPPKEIGDLWGLRGSAGRLLASRPQRVDRGPAQDFTLAEGLEPLPILQLWPRDGGRFVTFPLVLTEDPTTRKRNLGIYRMQVFDARTTGMHWQIGKGGGFHFHQAERTGQPLEVAVAVGADPATLLSAVAPLPEGIDELAFAGFLRGSSSRLARARTLSMRVPADAEFVIEGVVPPGERRTEGPFGDHFGHYSHAAPFPVFHVRAVTHRRRPVFQASVVGKPPQEDLWMGEAVQEMFTGVLKVIHPEIVDLWAYFEAGFHNLLVVAVDNRFAREAKKTALGLLGTGQLSLTKCVLLIDADVNPRDRDAVFAALARNFDPAEDLLLIPGVPLDTLDFTSYTMNLGSKMVLDAQSGRPRGAEPTNGRAPLTPETLADPRTFDERVLEWRLAWGGVLIVKVRGAVGGEAAGWESASAEAVGRAASATPGRQVIESLVRRSEYETVPLIVAVSEDVALDDPRERLWGWFTRFDCARDVIPAAVDVRGAWLSVRGPLGIDATWKPGYPEPVAHAPELIAQVDVEFVMTQTADRNSVRTQTVRDLFGVRRALIGMIHVGALPGTPAARHDLDALVGTAIEEARIYQSAGFHALMIENMHDRPYLNRSVGPEITAALTAIGREVRREVPLPLGVQVLAGANREALAVALACGASFVRCEGFVFAHVADEGLMNADAGELLRYRKAIGADTIRVFADIKKKHSAHAITSDVDIVTTALAAQFSLADGVIISGVATGQPTERDQVLGVREAVTIPVFVGSGLTPDTLKEYAGADGFIIGSAAKRDGSWSNPVDPARVAAFTAAHAKLEAS